MRRGAEISSQVSSSLRSDSCFQLTVGMWGVQGRKDVSGRKDVLKVLVKAAGGWECWVPREWWMNQAVLWSFGAFNRFEATIKCPETLLSARTMTPDGDWQYCSLEDWDRGASEDGSMHPSSNGSGTSEQDVELTGGTQTSQPDVHFQTTFDPKFICILNSMSLNNTVCACWVNWGYLTWVTAPRCTLSQVSLPTCATCSLTGGWKWDSWRDRSCNIDSGCWGHLGQFISAKQIIRLPRGKPKTPGWEGMDQIYPCQLKLPH